jgi:hypothetical protein
MPLIDCQRTEIYPFPRTGGDRSLLRCHCEERSDVAISNAIATASSSPRDDTGFRGGADRNRTGDLRRAKPALSQLSYSPNPIRLTSRSLAGILMVGLSGFEPLTSRLSGVRSNQLSYRPNAAFVLGSELAPAHVSPLSPSENKKKRKRHDVLKMHSFERR